jgi:hypothetical protein
MHIGYSGWVIRGPHRAVVIVRDTLVDRNLHQMLIPQLLHMDNLVWVNYPCRHMHIEMAGDLLANIHLHQLPYSQFTHKF